MSLFVQSVLVLLVCSAYGFVVWGWGNLFVRKAGLVALPVAWQVAAGLACLICIGGWLNLLSLAVPPVLISLLMIGAGLSAIRIYALCRSRREEGLVAIMPWIQLVWIAPLVIYVGFLGAYLSPPAVFNHHDDFEKYLVHPLRMLQTGNVAGGIFDAVGAETLGGMAYLQGFVAAIFSVGQVAAVDAVFMSGLFLWMIGSMLVRRQVHPALTALAVVALGAVNPQAVNVTAIYTGAALMLLAALGPTLLADGEWDERFPWFGLVLGAVIALKTTFLVPIVIIVLVYLAMILVRRKWRPIVRSFALFSVAIIISVLPWLLNSIQWAFLGLQTEIDPSMGLEAPLFSLHWLLEKSEAIGFGYGETWRLYQMLLLGGLTLAGWHLSQMVNDVSDCYRNAWPLSLTVGSLISAAIMLSSFSLGGLGDDATLRYQMPSLLAGCAVLVVCLMSSLSSVGIRRYKFYIVVMITFMAVCFIPSALFRLERVMDDRSHYALDGLVSTLDDRSYAFKVVNTADTSILEAQKSVPPRVSVLAMTSRNFQLNFQRNNVKVVNAWFLLVPWLRHPASGDIAGWKSFFRQQGIDYLIVDCSVGAGQKENASRSMPAVGSLQERRYEIRRYRFGEVLMALARQGELIYSDGRVLVARLPR